MESVCGVVPAGSVRRPAQLTVAGRTVEPCPMGCPCWLAIRWVLLQLRVVGGSRLRWCRSCRSRARWYSARFCWGPGFSPSSALWPLPDDALQDRGVVMVDHPSFISPTRLVSVNLPEGGFSPGLAHRLIFWPNQQNWMGAQLCRSCPRRLRSSFRQPGTSSNISLMPKRRLRVSNDAQEGRWFLNK